MNPKARRFGLRDLMILIAAVAVATLALRSMYRGMSGVDAANRWSITPYRLVLATILSAVATPMTLACLVFRIIPPRPRWRRAAIQPGMSAMMACSVLFLFRAAELVPSLCWPKVNILSGTTLSPIRFGESTSLVVMGTRFNNGTVAYIEPEGCFGVTVASMTTACGSAVAAVWLVLAVSGRWRPEKSWVDRLGRLLGATWIVIAMLAAFPV